MYKGRKYISLLLIVTILGAFGLAGCGSSKTEEKTQQTASPRILTIGTNTVGSGWYSMGGGLANILTKYIPGVKVTAAQTAASVENLKAIKEGTMELGFASGDVPYNMYRGIGYEENKGFKFLAMNDLVYLVIIVKKDSPIKTFEDIRGKRLGTGLAGSSAYVIVEDMLKAHGMTYADVKPFPAGISQQADALKDGNLDVLATGIGGTQGAAAAILDLATTTDIRFIPISNKVLDEITSKHPYYLKQDIPAGWVKSLTEPVPAMAIAAMLFVKADLPEDLVYNICKTMFEHKDELDATYGQWKCTTKDNVAKNMPVPLHPGAEKYYKEIGAPISYLK